MEWVAAWNIVQMGAHQDHQGAKLHVRSPDDPIRVKRPARIHPVPGYAEAAVRVATQQLLEDFSTEANTQSWKAPEAATKWEDLKTEIARRTRVCIRERKCVLRNTSKQKLVRLIKQQQRLRAEQQGAAINVESVTADFECLTLDETEGPTRAARLLRAIAECKKVRASIKRKRRFAGATHWEGKSTKDMYRRVSNKFGDNLIHRLDPIPGAPMRGIHEKADILGDAWTPILQQPPTRRQYIKQVVEWDENTTSPSPAQNAIAATITEDEVRRALRECKPGKAAGPDRLGNGWYRDYEDLLVPILGKLLNVWYDEGHFPGSFLDADIFCLKKGGSSSNALNFRPLALLNTDYKIFTRILASRVGVTLPETIHPNQNGFVTGRTIHDTLDLYTAAQNMVIVDPEQHDATAILLDFKKAYDSLDREYMLEVLRRKGYPAKFVQAVAATHSGTHVRFLANGAKSRRIEVTNGIRQGCPLAPLLFIIALDPLYRKLDGFLGSRGVLIQSAAGKFELRVSGYADDTAAFVRDPADIPRLMQDLNTFGKASGLTINADKTMVIALHPRGPNPDIKLPNELKYQNASDACRYLGRQVGSNISPDTSWNAVIAKLHVRLRIASQKVMTVDQRSSIARAIIVPNLMYVARHEWPTTAQINTMDTMIRNYVWHANFTTDIHGQRGWLDADIAALERSEGGIALPDIRAELYALAATTVGTWAELGTRTMHIVGDILFHHPKPGLAPRVYITPDYVTAAAEGFSRRRTLWATGKKLIAKAGAPEPADDGRRRQFVRNAFTMDGVRMDWNGNMLTVDCLELLSKMAGIPTMKEDTNRRGLQLEWLPYAECDSLQIYTKTGTRMSLAMATGQRRPCTHLQDLVRWQRIDKGRVNFSFKTSNEIITEQGLQEGQKFVQILLLNFLEIATHRTYIHEVRFTASPVEHPVIAEVRIGDEVHVDLHADIAGPPTTHRINSQGELIRKLTQYMEPEVIVHEVHPHQALSRLVCLWAGRRRWAQTRRTFKRRVAAATITRGKAKIEERASKWREQSTDAACGLDEMQWRRIRRVVGLGPWGEQLIHRLKLQAFSIYDVKHDKPGCPHETCLHQHDVTLHHIFWECGAAQRLRRQMLQPWRRLGLQEAGIETAIFGLRLHEIPHGIWDVADEIKSTSKDPNMQLAVAVRKLTEGCWRIAAAVYLQCVWRWRVNHYDVLNNVTPGYHTSTFAQKLRSGYTTVQLHMQGHNTGEIGKAASEILRRALAHSNDSHIRHMPVTQMGTYALFFGGRVQGQAGDAGCGAVVVRLRTTSADSEICWLSHMSYAGRRMTLHAADNQGLLHGLRECAKKKYWPLHVIGDNALVIMQHRRRTPPRASHLKATHWQCRRLMKTMVIRTWTHQTREANMMVGTLANMAMHNHTSRQVEADGHPRFRQQWDKVLQHKDTDLALLKDTMEDTTQEVKWPTAL